MKIFILNKKYSVVCDSKSTRYGFKHVASLCRNGIEIAETKINYLNRTWERFDYESILNKIISENFENKEKETNLKILKNWG